MQGHRASSCIHGTKTNLRVHQVQNPVGPFFNEKFKFIGNFGVSPWKWTLFFTQIYHLLDMYTRPLIVYWKWTYQVLHLNPSNVSDNLSKHGLVKLQNYTCKCILVCSWNDVMILKITCWNNCSLFFMSIFSRTSYSYSIHSQYSLITLSKFDLDHMLIHVSLINTDLIGQCQLLSRLLVYIAVEVLKHSKAPGLPFFEWSHENIGLINTWFKATSITWGLIKLMKSIKESRNLLKRGPMDPRCLSMLFHDVPR